MVLFVYDADMTQTAPPVIEEESVAEDGTLSTRLPPNLDQFVDDVAKIRRFNRSQAARLLISVQYDRIMRLPVEARASAIKRLG